MLRCVMAKKAAKAVKTTISTALPIMAVITATTLIGPAAVLTTGGAIVSLGIGAIVAAIDA